MRTPLLALGTLVLTQVALAQTPPAASFLNKDKHEKWGAGAPDWTVNVAGHKAVQAGEHPRLVFRKADIARLKQRAETPEGKVIVARLKTLLEGKFTLSHPAGHGLLYQLTGDAEHAAKAKELCEQIIDAKKSDAKDPRYGFLNPGGGGAMRAGPAIGVMGLAYDLNHDGWDADFRRKVATAILENSFTSSIAKAGPIGPGCNHYGAAVGGVGMGLLAIRGDTDADLKKVDDLLGKIIKQARDEIAQGYGDKGYYFEGHQCGRISSNTGLIPFIQTYRIAAGKDLVAQKENARWLSAKWIYEFARNPDGKYTDAQRGMYCRDFPRGGMWSENGDFSQGFGICPPEFLPALKWVYENQVEPGEKTYDVLDYPTQAIFALANWPIDIKAKNPADQPDLFPKVMYDAAAGHVIFRNGWSDKGDDICVSALLGTHPTNGRGMASGGSVYVYGKGLGWAGDRTKYVFPGAFFASYPTHIKFEKDGSGVISGKMYKDKLHNKQNQMPAAAAEEPTSLLVDYSRASGADCLVAMAGPGVGMNVAYWMVPGPAKASDVKGANGYETKTTEVTLGGKKAYVMTLQKGPAPAVAQSGDKVTVGGATLTFDGAKLVLAK